MTCEVKIIEDSISKDGVRLTTMQLKYWRAIHAEFMTHRVFSRNASSSRAIPVAKMLEQVRTNPAGPVHWGKNQPGMQAREELTGMDLLDAKQRWMLAAESAAHQAEIMMERGVHKQIVNRLLEPFQYISVIVTASEWENFFSLRAHPDAQPEIQELASEMRAALMDSHPKVLEPGEWHLPYVSPEERSTLDLVTAQQVSAARCARVSYLTHDGNAPSIEKDKALYEALVGSVPMHASPVEHQATPDFWSNKAGEWRSPLFHGNLRGWVQFRKILELQFNNTVTTD